MTENTIQKLLWGFFSNGYKYHIENSYVFDWESDFFCISNAGYVYECEIKTSRSDFLADFKKEKKHQLLKAIRPFTIKGHEQYNGYLYDINGRKRIYTYLSCGWDKRPIRTDFRYAFPNEGRPNKFIYVVPDGLVAAHEVPDYAGLIYVSKSSCKYVKNPPIIHKNKLDLSKTLLEKFYWAYRNLKVN